ncbi:MAG: alpha-ketoacid dehydrogenase subunit beta [Streptosporangiales bacterium]|nr:alpha-ketoacid dehydrogenase subunit beta [Streptosporangiales bacterium]
MTTRTMVESIRECLRQEMELDERVMVLGEDVGRLGGVFRATEGLLDRFGGERVVDMPVAEGAIVGAGIGLAISGLRPVVEIQFLGFGHQAFHQIGQQAARLRYRSQGRYGVPLVIRAPFGGGVRTPEMHSDAFEALYAHAPGLTVVAPATAYDAKGMLAEAIASDDPVLFLEPLKGYRLVRDDVPDERYRVGFGKARVVRQGDDVTLVAWSAAIAVAERAADELAAGGIGAEVVDLRSLVPLDTDTVRDSVARTGRVAIVQEAPFTGGFAAELTATIQQECFYELEAPILRITAPDTPYPLAGVEDLYVPDVDRVVAEVGALMAVPA